MIIQVLAGANGVPTSRRLAHHRSHYTGWGTRANADPTGSWALFQSNRDGTLQNPDGTRGTDVFILIEPLRPSGAR